MPDPPELRPEGHDADLSRREHSFEWSRLLTSDSPDAVLEQLGYWLGPKVVELTVGPVEPAADPVAVWRRASGPAGSTRQLSVLVAGEPVWRLSASLVGERRTVRGAVEQAAVLFEAWREARLALTRADRRLAVRSRELDLLQALGRGAAEARTPMQLFSTVVQVLHRSEELDLALVGFESDGQREMCTFLARPFDEVYLQEVARRAGRFMSWTTENDICARRDELDGFDPVLQARGGFCEEDLVLLPIVRRGQPVACLLVVPSATADDTRLRLLFGASNQLSLHLERILTVHEAEADRFRAIVDSMPQGVLLADSRLEILQANLPALQMLASVGVAGGNLERQLDGLGLRELVDRVREGAALAEGETYVDEDRVWSVTVSPMLGDRGHLDGLVFVMTDVTESRRLQQRLAQSEKMSSLGQMISGVAHELNNPLASVVGYAQLVRSSGVDEGIDRKLETLSREAARCKKIVQNLLAFVRQREPERRSLSLNQIVSGVLSLLAYQMRVDDVTVETDLSPDLPLIEGDPHQLEQVLVNLLTNGRHAIRSTDRPGTISLRTWVSRGDVIVLEVTDSGPGIPEEIRGRIFDPFFTTKGPGKGTGLGLSLVYGIVATHGGSVDVVSGEGRGTTFRILLPAGQPMKEVEERKGTEPVVAGGRKGRILVVDDEEPVARLICDALAAEGHVTQRAANGIDALERLEEGVYDLIISDLRMPGMSGEQLHEALQRDRPELSSRLLLTTGDTLDRVPEDFVARTGLDVLRKPFDLEDLLRKVQERLARGS